MLLVEDFLQVPSFTIQRFEQSVIETNLLPKKDGLNRI